MKEQSLHEIKKSYEKLMETASDAMSIIAGKDGTHVFVNKRMQEITGYTKSELLQISVRDMLDPDDLDRLEQRYIETMAGKRASNRFEINLVHKRGNLVPVEITDSMADWQGQPAVLQMEKSLRISEKNFRSMAKNATDGILLTAGEGVTVYANKGFARISGYTVSELCKMGIKELVPANEFKKVTKKYYDRIAGKKVADLYETNLVRKDGKIVAIEVSGSKTTWQNQTAVLGIYRDISERKKGEKEQVKVRDGLVRQVDERTSQLMKAAEEMKLKHNEVLFHQSELEKINQQLLDTNKALSALARNIDREREDAEKTVAKIARSRMLPLLEDFQKRDSFKKYRGEIDELMLCLNELAPGLKKGTDINLLLSATEIRIATMIKNGLSSPEIATVLHVSLDTVKSHRRNIRKKLKLNNSQINLASYLEAKM